MAIIISIGKWGGVWVYKGYGLRLCLGWVAVTILPVDGDNILHLASLSGELSLALEVASIKNGDGGWNTSSPFQDRINDLLTDAGRKVIIK